MANWDNERDRNQRWDRENDRGYRYQSGRYNRVTDDDHDYGSNFSRSSYDYDQGYGRGSYDYDHDSDWDYGTFYNRGRNSDFDNDYDRYSGPYGDWSSNYGYGRGSGSRWNRQYNSGYNTNYNRGLFNRGGSGPWGSGRGSYGGGYGGYGRSSGQGYNQSGYGQGDWGRYSDYDDDQDFYDNDWDTDFTPTYYTFTEYWLIPGPYSGMGPQGFQRSDDRIEEDVCDRLTQHGQIDASDMQVEVKNGEVFLRGEVNSRQAKRMAEDTAESVSGVKNVRNELKIRKGFNQGRQQGQMQGQQSQQGQMLGQQSGQQQTQSRVSGGQTTSESSTHGHGTPSRDQG